MCKTMLNVAWPAVVNNWHGFVCRKSGPLGTPDWLRWMDKPGNRKGRGCPALPKIISLSWLQQSCKFHNRSMKQTREWKRVPCHAQISYLVELERVLEYEYEILNVFIVRWGSYFGQIFFYLSLRMTRIHFYGKKLINVCWAFPRPISCATIMMFLSSFFWQTQCSKF